MNTSQQPRMTFSIEMTADQARRAQPALKQVGIDFEPQRQMYQLTELNCLNDHITGEATETVVKALKTWFREDLATTDPVRNELPLEAGWDLLTMARTRMSWTNQGAITGPWDPHYTPWEETREQYAHLFENESPSPLDRRALEQYIAAIAESQAETGREIEGVHAHIHRTGRRFASQPLTQPEIDLLETVDWRNHVIRRCYANAQETAKALPDTGAVAVRYAEGYVMVHGVPLEHAWITLNGKVVDTTVRTDQTDSNRILGTFPANLDYFGVEMTLDEWVHEAEHSPGPVIDDWICGWPKLARTPPVTPAST